MAAIHLVEKVNNVRPVPGTSDEWESGDWVMTVASAGKLIDGDIYLHRGQQVPSHFGGKILSFRQHPTDSRRVIFRFKSMPSHKGVTPPPDGWGNEQNRRD